MNGALDAFTAEVRRPDAELRLDRAALLIAAGEYHGLDIERYVALLDEIGARALALAPAGASPRGLAGAVREHLFHDLGFRGNEEDYYDARNSYLNEVITRRTGIPISLAAVFLEVARRVGLDAAGVSYPRHCLVKYWDGDGSGSSIPSTVGRSSRSSSCASTWPDGARCRIACWTTTSPPSPAGRCSPAC